MLADKDATILRRIFCPGSLKFWSLRTDGARLLYLAILKHRSKRETVSADTRDLCALCPQARWKPSKVRSMVTDLTRVGLVRRSVTDKKLLEIVPPNGTSFSENSSEVAGSKEPFVNNVQNVQKEQNVQNVQKKEREVSLSVRDIHTRNLNLSSDVQNVQNGTHRDDPKACFDEAKKLYRRRVRQKLPHLGPREPEWNSLVREHGSETVIAAFKMWLAELDCAYVKTMRWPASLFFKEAEELIDAVENPAQEEEAPTGLHEDENQRRFDAAVAKYGTENVKWNDSPFDSARIMVNVGGEWVPPEIAESVCQRQEQDAREREARKAQEREAEIDRRFDEEMTKRHGDDWTYARLRPSPEFDAECAEVRKQIERQLAGTVN